MSDTSGHRPCIVAASDLSVGSDLSLVAAERLAQRLGAALHVFHCVPRPVFPFVEGVVSDEARSGWIESAREELRWQVHRVLGGRAGEYALEVGLGDPASEIGAHASEIGAGLIVVGPHEPRGVFDDLLGSTADRLIRTAAIPCLVAARPLSLPLRRVLMPVDFSPPSVHAARVATDLLASGALAGAGDAEETSVEVLYVSAFGAAYALPFSTRQPLAELADQVRSRISGEHRVSVEPRILSAQLAIDGIRMAAEQIDADLIVMGTHGFGRLGRALIGSVASAVVRRLRYSVLLVPPPSQD